MWAVLILTMLGLVTNAIIDSSLKFLSYPSTTQSYTEYNDNITFPAITVCDNNLVMYLWILIKWILYDYTS